MANMPCLNLNPDRCIFMKPNEYYQYKKHIEPRTSPKDLNNLCLDVTRETTTKLGIILRVHCRGILKMVLSHNDKDSSKILLDPVGDPDDNQNGIIYSICYCKYFLKKLIQNLCIMFELFCYTLIFAYVIW